MNNMADIIEKLIGKRKGVTINPVDMGYLLAGGVGGFYADALGRAWNQKAVAELVGGIASALGTMFLPNPWNIVSAGALTGVVIGAVSDPIRESATKMVAMSKNIPQIVVVTDPRFNQRKGYMYDMHRSGMQNVTVKAPVYNGGRYTV